MSRLDRLGRAVLRRHRFALVSILLATIGAGVLALASVGHFANGGFGVAVSDSARTTTLLQKDFGGTQDFMLVIRARDGSDVGSTFQTHFALEVQNDLRLTPGVSNVASWWTTGDPTLISRDRTSGVIVAGVHSNAHAAKVLAARFGAMAGPAEVIPSGPLVVENELGTHIAHDLLVIEAVAVPLTLLLLVVVFRSLAAALIPLAVAGVSLAGATGILGILARLTTVSVFALDLVSALSLGLAVDYSLLLVSRYREERARGSDPDAAILATVRAAGHTIMYSAVTVTFSLAAMVLFPLDILRSFAYAGVAVVIVAAATALVLVPALLKVLSGRLDTTRARNPDGSRIWRRTTRAVCAHPAAAGMPVVVLLLALGTPFLHASFGSPDDRALPASAPAHQSGAILRTAFDDDVSQATVVVLQDVPAKERTTALQRYELSLSRIQGVGAVRPGELTNTGSVALSLIPSNVAEQLSPKALVRTIRDIDTPGGVHPYMGGIAAATADAEHVIGRGVPWVLSLVAVAVFLTLLVYTRSIVLPAKALVLDAIGLSAVFGSLVWVFQEGHLKSVFGFTPAPVNVAMPVLMFCVAFGLSMDYEVFLLSRVKEAHQAGASTTDAIVDGVAKTAGLLTAAAALLAVSLFTLAASGVTFAKMLGIGTGLAILVDATLIRGILVPAFMQVMGEANWWAPRLRRLPVTTQPPQLPTVVTAPQPVVAHASAVVLAAQPVPAPPQHPDRRLGRQVLVGAGVLATVALGLSGYLVGRRQPSAPQSRARSWLAPAGRRVRAGRRARP